MFPIRVLTCSFLIVISVLGCVTKSDVPLVGTAENAVVRVDLINTVFSGNRMRCFIPLRSDAFSTWENEGRPSPIGLRAAGIFKTLELFENQHPDVKIKEWKVEHGYKNSSFVGLWLELEPKNISVVR